jgi:hypothetical protein
MFKEGCMFLKPQYGAMTGSSQSTSTTLGMDVPLIHHFPIMGEMEENSKPPLTILAV